MNAKLFLIIRIILGLMLITFGLNKFLNFMPMMEMNEAAGSYFSSLMASKTMMLVAIVEIAAGLAFILNKYGALMAIILMSVSVNAVLFHLSLNIENIAPALVLLVLNVLVLIGYKNQYHELLGCNC